MSNKKYDRETVEKVKEFLKVYLVEKGVKFNGNYFKCFQHDDTHASAMIMKDGKRYKCFGCNYLGDIFDAFTYFEGESRFNVVLEKLINKYLINADVIVIDSNKNKQKKYSVGKRGKFEDEYVYTDEIGREVYKIQRYANIDKNGKEIINKKGKKDKYFIAYKKVSGKWIKGIGDTPRYIYNLKKVKKAIERNEIILFVEGEKSCKILEELGFCTTTTPFGANGLNQENIERYKKQIEGASLVLLADNDQNGYEYMKKIEKAFMDVVKSIKVVNLVEDMHNLPDSGDVEEWLYMGGSKEKLLKLILDSKNIKDTHEYLDSIA